MADTKLVICEKCLGTGHVNSCDENSTWSKTCEDCHGIGFSRVPMTNADRIRAMSDDELIEFIKNIKVRAALCKAVKNNDAFEELCSAEWLQQPAE